MFGYYRTRHAIFAFRFLAKVIDKHSSRIKKKTIKDHKIVDNLSRLESVPLIKCTQDGKTSLMRDGKWFKKNFPNYVMPFMALNA